eukprot:tig00000704_g3308.t1
MWGSEVEHPRGLQKWVDEYKASRPSVEELQASVDEWMAAYEERERTEREEKLKRRNVPDDDGFVLVQTKGRRNTVRDATGATVVAARAVSMRNLDLDKGLRKQKEGFYRHQRHEQRKRELEKLRQDFDRDRKKLRMAQAAQQSAK